MIGMTEEEAKEKWCPMVKPFFVPTHEYAERTALLNVTRNEGGNNCIASACMMWRWEKSPEYVAKLNKNNVGDLAIAVGFCGLAGKP